MTALQTTVGYHEFPPEKIKLIVITDAPSNPLRPTEKRRVAIRHHEDVVWVREMQAAVTYIHGGRVIRQGELHSDWYGFMTAADELIENDLPALQKRYAVSADSSLEMTVRLGLVDTPTLGFVEATYQKRKYQALGSGVFLANDIPDETDFFTTPWEDKVAFGPILHSIEDAWSTKKSLEENLRSFAAYKEKAIASERFVGAVLPMDCDLDHVAA